MGHIHASHAAGRRRAWKFQKCAPVQLAYEPNWRVMISPGRGMGVRRGRLRASSRVRGPSLTHGFYLPRRSSRRNRRGEDRMGVRNRIRRAMSSAGDVPPDDGGGSFRPADTMDLDEDEDDNNARAEVRVLVGGEGGLFVAQTLSTAEDVGEAITRCGRAGRSPRTRPRWSPCSAFWVSWA